LAAPGAAFDAFAVAPPGVAPLLAAECEALGLVPTAVTPAGVGLALPPAALFRLNLWSRLATRVLVRLGTFPARDFATLARRSAGLPWGDVLPPRAPVGIRVTCRKSRLYHSDAVAERVGEAIGRAVPSAQVRRRAVDDDAEDQGDAEAARTLVVVRLERDQCTVSVDSSGALLHRRGWRLAVAKAPLRETLAAALLAACGWDGGVPLLDPFGGSGTIGIEAALRARGIAPGVGRPFALERWPLLDTAAHRAQWAAQRGAARAAARGSAGVPIVMRDRDAGACAAARANAERAGVGDDVLVEEGALSTTAPERWGPRGLLLTNPPYGVRVGDDATLRALYARLGAVVRGAGAGWEAAMLVADPRMGAATGLRLHPLLHTATGGIPVALLGTPRG
jgi:putative N6-adenine-specific DNA methylase